MTISQPQYFDIRIFRNTDPAYPNFTVRLTNPIKIHIPSSDVKEVYFSTLQGAEAFVKYLRVHPDREWGYSGTETLKAEYSNTHIAIRWLEDNYPDILRSLSFPYHCKKLKTIRI